MATTPPATTTGLRTTDEVVLDGGVVQQYVMFPDDGDGSDTGSSDHQELSTSSSDKYGTVELATHVLPLEGDVAVGRNSEGILRDAVEVASVVTDVSVLPPRQPHPGVTLENCNPRFSCTSLENPASRSERATCSSVDREASDNAFGIAYQPHRLNFVKTEEYNLPAGPAFVDEDEFEAQLSSEFDVPQKGTARGSPNCCLGTPTSERRGGSMSDLESHNRDHDGADANGFENNTTHTECSNTTDKGIPTQVPLQPCIVAQHAVGTESLIGTSGGDDASCVQIQPDKEYARNQNFDLQLEGSKALDLLAGAYQPNGAATKVSCGAFEEIRENMVRATASNEAEETPSIGDSAKDDTGGCCAIQEEEEDDLSDDEAEGVHNQNQDAVKGVFPQLQVGAETKVQREEVDDRAEVLQQWEAIDQLRTAENSVPMKEGVGGALKPACIDAKDKIVNMSEALAYFRSQDLSVYRSLIVSEEPRPQRWRLFRRPETLRIDQAEKHRDEIFLISQVHYTPADVVHRRIIQTVYRRMTGDKRACPDEGPHWDTVGFQGNDPRTDLNRSMGMFSLVQVLYLLETQPTFAAKLYRTSMEGGTGWPFLCVSIGFTKEAVGALRRGDCYAECNRKGVVLQVVNELHQAQFHEFLTLCKSKQGAHHAVHLSTVRASMQKGKSTALVRAYRKYLLEERNRAETSITAIASAGRMGKLDFRGTDDRSETRKTADEGVPSRFITSYADVSDPSEPKGCGE